MVFAMCVNWLEYRYKDQCVPSGYDNRKCNENEMRYCFQSYPNDSPLGLDDPDAACRTILDHNRDDDYEWAFDEETVDGSDLGLCILNNDPDMKCARSWDP